MCTTFPGEMFSATGKKVKRLRRLPGCTSLGSDGHIGYFPERQAYAGGGYEIGAPLPRSGSRSHYLRSVTELMKRFR